MYTDDAVLLAESELGLEKKKKSEFDRVCERRKLKVNAKTSKVIVFERNEYEKNCLWRDV